jgi:hypothetical protein
MLTASSSVSLFAVFFTWRLLHAAAVRFSAKHTGSESFPQASSIPLAWPEWLELQAYDVQSPVSTILLDKSKITFGTRFGLVGELVNFVQPEKLVC